MARKRHSAWAHRAAGCVALALLALAICSCGTSTSTTVATTSTSTTSTVLTTAAQTIPTPSTVPSTTTSTGQSGPPSHEQAQALADQADAGTVLVTADGVMTDASGSEHPYRTLELGVVYAQGVVLCSSSLAAGPGQPPTSVSVTSSSGDIWSATVTGVDSARGVAVLKVDGLDLPPLAVGGVVPVGSWVVVAEHDGGVRVAAVRSVAATLAFEPPLNGLLELEGAVYGSAVALDAEGRLVGLVVTSDHSADTSLALPVASLVVAADEVLGN